MTDAIRQALRIAGFADSGMPDEIVSDPLRLLGALGVQAQKVNPQMLPRVGQVSQSIDPQDQPGMKDWLDHMDAQYRQMPESQAMPGGMLPEETYRKDREVLYPGNMDRMKQLQGIIGQDMADGGVPQEAPWYKPISDYAHEAYANARIFANAPGPILKAIQESYRTPEPVLYDDEAGAEIARRAGVQAEPSSVYDGIGRGRDWSNQAQGIVDGYASGGGVASYDTELTPEEELAFQQWKQHYAPQDSGEDYDYRGAYKSGLVPDSENGHWPDTFKKPNHPTFSIESLYAKEAPDRAGRWEGENYIAPGYASGGVPTDLPGTVLDFPDDGVAEESTASVQAASALVDRNTASLLRDMGYGVDESGSVYAKPENRIDSVGETLDATARYMREAVVPPEPTLERPIGSLVSMLPEGRIQDYASFYTLPASAPEIIMQASKQKGEEWYPGLYSEEGFQNEADKNAPYPIKALARFGSHVYTAPWALAEAVGHAAKEGFGTFGRALAGEDISDEEEARRAADLAGIVPIGGVVASAIGAVPENAAGMFAGTLSKTADRTKLMKAKELEARGAPREQIWNETGWFKGGDNKWRYEIDDSQSKWNSPGESERVRIKEIEDSIRQRFPNEDLYEAMDSIDGTPEMKEWDALQNRRWERDSAALKFMVGDKARLLDPLYQSLDHPAIYEAYPSFAKSRVAETELGHNMAGGVDESGNMFVSSTPPPGLGGKRSIALHEAQHLVQDKEGFASGANARSMSAHPDAAPLAQFYFDELKAGRNPDGVFDADAPQMAAMANDDLVMDAAMRGAAMQLYRRAYGEVESRNVQKRRDMTPEERQALPPWTTEDIPADKQIYDVPRAIRNGSFFSNPDEALIPGIVLAYGEQKPEHIPSPRSYRESPHNTEMMAKLKEEYGETDYAPAGGYMAPDGTFVDFSFGQGKRSEDHRAANSVVPAEHRTDPSAYGARASDMKTFMSGSRALRWQPESPGFEANMMPTREQLRSASRAARENWTDDDFYVDVSDPRTGEVVRSETFQRPSFDDLNGFFSGLSDEGIKLFSNREEALLPGVVARGEDVPIRAYHGASSPWDGPFNPERATAGAHSHPRPYFADNPQEASGYALSRDDTLHDNHARGEASAPNVISADIDIKNPFNSSMNGPDGYNYIAPKEYKRLTGLKPQGVNKPTGYDVMKELYVQEADKVLPDEVRALRDVPYDADAKGYWGYIYDEDTARKAWEGVYGRLEKAGYDGLVEPRVPSDYADARSYTKIIPFKRGTVKSATTGETLFSNADEAGIVGAAMAAAKRELDRNNMYSPSLEAVKGLKQEKGTVEQFRSQIIKGGGKEKELQAVGFDKAFPDKSAKVSRADIEKFLRENRVELGETSYRGHAEDTLIPRDGEPKFENWSTPGGIPGSYREIVTTLPRTQALSEAELTAFKRDNPNATDADIRSMLTERDDPNYRSSHWPGITNPLLHYRTKDFESAALSNDAIASGMDKVAKGLGVKHAELKPEHFTEAVRRAIIPEELAEHLAWASGAKGFDAKRPPNKTRVLDELQSDWAQRARDHGLKDPAEAAALSKQLEEANVEAARLDKARDAAYQQLEASGRDFLDRKYPQEKDSRGYVDARLLGMMRDPAVPEAMKDNVRLLFSNYEQAKNAHNAARDRVMDLTNKWNSAEHGVPSAPFISNTSDWVDLGLKQALIDAARDPSVSRLAWAPGKVQADRYGLERHVDSLMWRTEPAYEGFGGTATGTLEAYKDGRKIFTETTTADKLPDFLGKETADKLLSQGSKTIKRGDRQYQHAELSGLDLKTGGEGMKSFYGNMSPEGYQSGIVGTRLQKLIKGLDPEAANVETFEVPMQKMASGEWRQVKEDGLPYPSIPITETLRRKILEDGLPMFVNGFPIPLAPSDDPDWFSSMVVRRALGRDLP